MVFDKITVVGVGLIGGSLARAWKKHRGGSLTITGVDTPEVLARATVLGVIDQAEPELHDAVTDADLVVLSTPLTRILYLLDEVAPSLKDGAVVTDVGSVKAAITEYAAKSLRDDVLFVGGHPMAGAENAGIEYSDPFLFENASYAICPPDDKANDPRLQQLIELIEVTGARPLQIDPVVHDQVAAFVSHLPQLLAVVLTNLAADRNESDANYLRLAAGGFRDMTRIASSDYDMWRDILSANQGPVLDALAALAASVQAIRNRMIEEDTDEIARLFDRARSTRETIPKDSKGFIRPLADLYVHADDRPGWIASVATLLSEADINIKDMELLKVREGTGGTFRLSFEDRTTATRASELLESNGFAAYRLE